MRDKIKFLAIIMLIFSVLLASCSHNNEDSNNYGKKSEEEKVKNQNTASEPSNNFIQLLILINGEEFNSKSILHHFQQTLVTDVNVTVKPLDQFSASDSYDLVYLDRNLTLENSPPIKEQLIEYVNNGGTLFLSHEYASQFPANFTGIEQLKEVTDKQLTFTYPEVRLNLKGLQTVWKSFSDIYEKYNGLDPELHIDLQEAAIVNTATPLVKKGDLSLLTVNETGKGHVIWANTFLPNEQFITRFDLIPENDQEYFHFGYASANYLFRNELLKFVSKEKHGFAIQKTYGPYGRPGLAWQAHYESLYSFVLEDMIKWIDLLEEYNQIPTFSIVRGSYRGGRWYESLRFMENIGSNSDPQFVNVEQNSFFSAGKAITTENDILRFEGYPGYNSLLSSVTDPYRAYVTINDWNQDSKQDLLIGSKDGHVYFVENSGEATDLIFSEPKKLEGIHVSQYAAPHAYDWNKDGHDDLLVGDGNGYLFIYINKGNQTFDSAISFQANGDLLNLGGAISPFATDWNEDGIMDLLVGLPNGQVYFFANMKDGGTELEAPIAIETTNGVLQVNEYAAPYVIDWNEDGNKDLLVGDANGEISLVLRDHQGNLVNEGPITGKTKNFFGTNTIKVGHFAVPAVVDWNEDGKKDIITGHLEYGSPYAIDDQLFPYKEEFQKNIQYAQEKHIPLIPHMYLNEYMSDEAEKREMEIHKKAFNDLGIPWDKDMGVNHHTWRINKNALQSFNNQKNIGIWWNFGFNPPNVRTAPRDGKEFLMVIPFMLPDHHNKLPFQEFMLFSPAPNALDFAQSWDSLAKYDVPLTYFEHIEHSMEPGTEVYQKLIDEITFMNNFRDTYSYTFMTEEQMARAMLNTFYTMVDVQVSENQITVTPDYSNVPEHVNEYKHTLGIKLEPGEKFKDKKINTSSMFYYEGNESYYLGVDQSINVHFVDETAMFDTMHIVKSNSPVSIENENNLMKLTLGTKGMQEIEIYSPIELEITGKDLRVKREENYYTIIHYGDIVEVTLQPK